MQGKTYFGGNPWGMFSGFNEAPAKCRGKHRIWMRRHDYYACFNEAPAKCRGKPSSAKEGCNQTPCFNEAPAKCRGKLERRIASNRSERASMRPPRNAGENLALGCVAATASPRFNEAPAKCRGKPTTTCSQPAWQFRFNEAPAKCRGKPVAPAQIPAIVGRLQ